MISQLLSWEEREQIKDLMMAYSSFMIACHHLNNMDSKASAADAEAILGDIADAGSRVYDLQQKTGIVMFADPRALLAALTGKSITEDCRVAAA